MCRFCWPSPAEGAALGAFHALDVPFVFDDLDDPVLLGDDPPQHLARQMHEAWTRFATTGDPAGGAITDWPCYDDSRAVLMFDDTSTVRLDPDAERREVWRDLTL